MSLHAPNFSVKHSKLKVFELDTIASVYKSISDETSVNSSDYRCYKINSL